MTPQELLSACEGREYIQLTSPDNKRPIPRMRAELLCVNPNDGHSVWLYKTKDVLKLVTMGVYT